MDMREEERALREAVVSALEGVGKDTGEALAALRHRAKMNRRLIRIQAALGAALVLVVVVLISTIAQIRSNAVELEKVQDRTNNEVLCPLYEIFAQSAKNPPPPQYSEKQKAERLEAIKVIMQGYEKLGCKD